MRNTILIGDILAMAATLAPSSVQTIATSPPYWGLRAYPVPVTEWPSMEYAPMPGLPPITIPAQTACLGQESDPAVFVGHLVLVFRSLRRALKDDGTLWLNLGDSYARTGGTDRAPSATARVGSTRRTLAQQPCRDQTAPDGIAPKNLIGIPWRAAFALQADGWTLRSEVIWHKKSPMPESVTDRPTKAHEQVFLFGKGPRYYYDANAIAEPISEASKSRIAQSNFSNQTGGEKDYGRTGVNPNRSMRQTLENFAKNGRGFRNKRTVWSPSPAQFPGAHFATFPPDLVRPMILAGSREGDIVLDPFSGSGTTLAVAQQERRDWIGIDADPRAVEWTQQRLAVLPARRLPNM